MNLRKRVLPVILLAFVNGLSFFILIPVLPFIVRYFGANDVWYTALISIFSAAQFVGSAWFGTLSDKYGRRKILILSQAGTLLSWFLFGASWFFDQSYLGITFFPLLIIGISRITDGITGGNSSVASAYLADITTHEERGKVYGYMGGAFGLAMIIGPGLGGYFASFSIGYLGTAIAAALISVIALLFIIFLLKESLPSEKRTDHDIKLWQQIKVWKKIKSFSNNKFIQKIFTIEGVFSFVMSAYSSILPLYIIDRFGFDTRQLSYFFFATGIFLFINQIVLLKRFIQKFGDFKTLIIGQCLMMGALILYVIPAKLWVFIVIYYFINLGVSLSFPTIKSLLSKSASPKRQGEISGLDESIKSLMAVFAPIFAGFLYIKIGYISFWIFAGILLLEVLLIASSCQKKNIPQ